MPLSTNDRARLLARVRGRVGFYVWTSLSAFWLWRACQLATVLGSAGAGLAAALEGPKAPHANSWAIGLSAVTTVAATLLTTMKFGEHHRIREVALVGMREVRNGLDLHFAMTPPGEEDDAVLAGYVKRMSEIEYDQVNLMKALEGATPDKKAHC